MFADHDFDQNQFNNYKFEELWTNSAEKEINLSDEHISDLLNNLLCDISSSDIEMYKVVRVKKI